MRILALIVFSILLSVSAHSQELQRVPVSADYLNFISKADEQCNSCSVLLLPGARPNTSSIVYVRSTLDKSKKDSISLEAGYFKEATSNKLSIPSFEINDFYGSAPISLANTNNPYLIEHYAEEYAKEIMVNPALKSNATFIISRDSKVDASLFIKYSGQRNFIVEQYSNNVKFDLNMRRMAARSYSQDVKIFDFTPRTSKAIAAMKASGTSLQWRYFSWRLQGILETSGLSGALGVRTKSALVERLSDSSGGVIIVYAHSDGESIFLDTDRGPTKLTMDDIKEIGKKSSNKLPPVILLNCNTRSGLARTFIDAGSPFVATTDYELQVEDAVRFIRYFARALQIEKNDVIDAYFAAQSRSNLVGLRPIAGIRQILKQAMFEVAPD